MQINYDSYDALRSAGFWNYPQIYNASQAVEVPPIYAPYGTPGFWQDGAQLPACYGSGFSNTVGAAMSAQASAAAAAPASPPSTPAAAAASGQPLAPITLVSPLPSITAIAKPAASVPSAGCAISSWASANPGLAVAAAVGLFFLLRGVK